ncbi:SRPBCC domain-containing protein [Roseibium aestuarii]|uniref:SRPBCC domain-containing protein n=1 Tax=Roseibium aestuarii TaxID=2600299 RepID=A0ABW4JW53_9HYPH|nr:SRPBCC domain-containing protein [Roseibium aestuarii]
MTQQSAAVEALSSERFATLTLERDFAAPASVVWQIWTSPAARLLWAPPYPAVTVDFLEADTRVGGREVSRCSAEGHPDMLCDVRWLDLAPELRSISSEVMTCDGVIQSAALITADLQARDTGTRLTLTIQISALDSEMTGGYRAGYGACLGNMASMADRTMILQRRIPAPRDIVWGTWVNPDTLPQWWGPDGFSCRTTRIDLSTGGEWLFDMIGPDGTVYPNHHLYTLVSAPDLLSYTLLWGENGPKHADAWASFEAQPDGSTRVTLGMIFTTEAEYQTARGFGAVELGHQTLAKLEAFIAAT